MTTFENVLRSVEAVGAFLQQQRADLDERAFLEVKKTQAGQVVAEIRGCAGLTAEQATQLGEALRTGPWSGEDRALFAGSLSDVLANRGPAGGVVRRKSQQVTSFAAYFSGKDLAVLADNTVSIHVKADQIATRMVRVQLWLPAESAYKEVIKTAMAAGLQLDTVKAKVSFKETLKNLLQSKTKNFSRKMSLPNPLPEKPEQLPDAVFQQAYASDDPPHALAELQCLTQSMTLRKSSSAYKAEAEPSNAMVKPTKANPAVANADAMQLMGQAFMQICSTFMQTNSDPTASSSQASVAEVLKNFKLLNAKKPRTSMTPTPTEKDSQEHAEDDDTERLALTESQSPAEKPAAALFTPPPPLPAPVEPAQEPLDPEHAAMLLEGAISNRAEAAADERTETFKKPAAAGKGRGKGMKRPCSASWRVERIVRGTGKSKGQTDTYYHSPDGRRYRTLAEAQSNGYKP